MIHWSTLEPHSSTPTNPPINTEAPHCHPIHQQWNCNDQPTHQHWTHHYRPTHQCWNSCDQPTHQHWTPHYHPTHQRWRPSLCCSLRLETLNHLWHAAAKHVMLPESALVRESAMHAVNPAILVWRILILPSWLKAKRTSLVKLTLPKSLICQPTRDLDLYQQCQANSGCMILKSNN